MPSIQNKSLKGRGRSAPLSSRWHGVAVLYAAFTGKLTKAYLTPDGIVRFTTEGYPIDGQFLGAVDPPQKESK